MSIDLRTPISRGQALIETALLMPLLILIILAIVWFGRVLLTRQQLVTAARYGTDLILYSTLNEAEIRREIRNYLTHRFIQGRTLDPRKLPDGNIIVMIKEFELPDFTFADYLFPEAFIARIIPLEAQFIIPQNYTSSVEINYPFEFPAVFALASAGTVPRSFYVSARSEVLAGTGCRHDIHRRNRS